MCYGRQQWNNNPDFPCGPVLGLGTFTAVAQSSIPGQELGNLKSQRVAKRKKEVK